MAQGKPTKIAPLNGKPPPPAGVQGARAAPVVKGFIPPPMHRQKVEVSRVRPTPVPPPMVAEVAPVARRDRSVEKSKPAVVKPVVKAPATVEPQVIRAATIPPTVTKPVVKAPAVVEPQAAASETLTPAIVTPVARASAKISPEVIKAVTPAPIAVPVIKSPSLVEPEVFEPQTIAPVIKKPIEPPPAVVQQTIVALAVEASRPAEAAVVEPMKAEAVVVEPDIEEPPVENEQALAPRMIEVRRISAPDHESPVIETQSIDVQVSRPRAVPSSAGFKALPRFPLLRYWGTGAIAMMFLLTATAFGGFWLHSLGAIDRVTYGSTDGRYYWIESWHGAIYCHVERDPSPIDRQLDVWRVEVGDAWARKDPPPAISGAAWMGVMLTNKSVLGVSGRISYLVVSYWLLVIILLVPAGWWLRNRRRLWAMCRGRKCLRCGYDLRSTTDRCPECGMPGRAAEQVTEQLVRQLNGD